jgi:hypothetical protein
MEQQNEKFIWKNITKEEYEKWQTKKYIPGQLVWLQSKTNRSEYEEAVYKKLIEKYGTTE